MKYYIQNNTHNTAHIFNGIGCYCGLHEAEGFEKERFSVMENLNGREVCHECIASAPKHLAKQHVKNVKRQKPVKKKKPKRVSQVFRLPRHSEKPDTVNFNHKDWPISVKTGKRMSYEFIASDKFLASFDWRRVRMAALANTEGRCECCGATSGDGALLNVDHVMPRKYYPQFALSLSNLQILCVDCNVGKGNDFMIHWKSLKTDK